MMRALSIFVLIAVLLVTMASAQLRPELHKPYILAPQNFKLEDFGQIPSDLQSIQMFKLGDAPVQVAVQDVPVAPVESETKIIPSDIKIIPSDFIQQVPAHSSENDSNGQVSEPDNSDKMLEEVGKMVESAVAQAPKFNDNKEVKGAGCSICDSLSDPKVRSELIAWNKWRSDIQNRIMETSDVEAPYGTLFYFMFNVDNQRRVSKISVISRGEVSNKDVQNIKTAILRLNNDKILQFPKGTNRKTVNCFGGFLMSDVSIYSSPSDYKDFEYVQTAH